LADFMSTITQTSDTDFPNAIMQAFDVDGFLRRMALDVLSGHWDNYWVNANNYYLFLHPETRRWDFIPYDFDNAFGINWIGSDWAWQNIYDWKNLGDDRPNTPLANRLFAVPEFSNRYSFYMKQMLDTVFTNALIDPAVFHTRSTLTNSLPFAPGAVPNMLASDRDRYSWGDGNWPWWSYDQRFWSYVDAQGPWNGNVPNQYGLTNFIGARRASALAQLNLQNIGPILSDFSMSPSLPRTNDAVTVSIRAVDDVAVTNVSFVLLLQWRRHPNGGDGPAGRRLPCRHPPRLRRRRHADLAGPGLRQHRQIHHPSLRRPRLSRRHRNRKPGLRPRHHRTQLQSP
jgi:hypothetical protein